MSVKRDECYLCAGRVPRLRVDMETICVLFAETTVVLVTAVRGANYEVSTDYGVGVAVRLW